jgi:hypothetical protein
MNWENAQQRLKKRQAAAKNGERVPGIRCGCAINQGGDVQSNGEN